MASFLDLLSEDPELDSMLANVDSTEYQYHEYVDVKLKTSEFKDINPDDVNKFLYENVNPNTKRKTLGDLKIFNTYLRSKRLVKPRAYDNPNEPQKDPVHVCKTHQEKRPADMNTADSPFFLTPASWGQLSWFRKSAIGINKLYGIMTEMMDAADIEAPRVTPYSTRKRLVQKFNDDGVPPSQIIQISGHKNVNSLNKYSHMNTEQCGNISNRLSNSKSLDNRKYTPPTSTTRSLQGSPNQSGAIPTGFFNNPIFHGPVNFTFSAQSLSQLTSVTQTERYTTYARGNNAGIASDTSFRVETVYRV